MSGANELGVELYTSICRAQSLNDCFNRIQRHGCDGDIRIGASPLRDQLHAAWASSVLLVVIRGEEAHRIGKRDTDEARV
jgi:hypothetical protein